MADKSGPATTGRAPGADRPADIRNVVLVGPSGAGKTTLMEALLHASGATGRRGRVEDGTTVGDHDEAAVRQKRSVGLSTAPLSAGGLKITLVDTPGYADFLGELRAGLRAADAALFTLSALDGVDPRTRLLWEECAAAGMPRAVALTRIDHPRADVAATVEQCRRELGGGVMPAYLPVYSGDGEDRRLDGLVGLLSRTFFDHRPGAPEPGASGGPVPGHVAAEVEELRNGLIEEVIQESEDEVLMEAYMEGGELDPDRLVASLETAVARGGLHPVVPVCPVSGPGVAELLRELPASTPSPAERPVPEAVDTGGRPVQGLECDPDGPLLAQVVQTVSDPYVGRISLVRVFSGTLHPDEPVHVSGSSPQGRDRPDRDGEERIGALSVPMGRQLLPAAKAVAGDICAVAKLSTAETGDTLSGKDRPLTIRPWAFPEPLLPVALRAASKSDEDRLAQAVARLSAEDAALKVEVNPETRQMVLWCTGEAHLDVALDRLKSRYGVEVETGEVRIPLRETFTVPAQGLGRNVKQSGGHGEYGICRIKVEPLPSGAGLEFVDEIVGGVVPRQYIPSVEKGVRAQMESGGRTGFPLVDLRVTLYDGKSHSVDSSDMAFQKAGRLALRDAAEHGETAMLEPVDELSVLVDDAYVGAVMSDLAARRGRVVGTEPVAGGRTLIKAEVPELETVRYAVDLRSVGHGTGSFSRRYLRHEPLPPDLARRFREEAGTNGG
ncbi:elongation factor G-like protein EF-G2 [Nocardiopsis baichengensis]|uniref:elongation factor G-like protein EF-G2 n=1 Tax=Nocardiopsis baichengensis TaxID=280240 RepID=UPI00034942AA|nr:elongation factor G-like protein EF-G2 [Nocardiopsis baichengensis]